MDGTTFHRISEGDLTVNDNIGVCLGAVDITETVAHELGHTIGLDHSSDTEALMYQFAHHDGRGGQLSDDDVLGVSMLYPEPDVDGDGIPDARDRCPSTPAGFIIDANGCACTEPGSAGCDDDDHPDRAHRPTTARSPGFLASDHQCCSYRFLPCAVIFAQPA